MSYEEDREATYDEDYDNYPLANPAPITVAVSQECLPDTDHPLTVDEICDSWASILEDSPYPLLVSGYMLVDRIRMIDGFISGHIAGSGDPKGLIPKETWIKMDGHCVQRITGIGPTKGQLSSTSYSPVFQFRCFWCGNSMTYPTTKQAYDQGWKTLYDPLGNNIEFCPCQECQDRYLEYLEMFNYCKGPNS